MSRSGYSDDCNGWELIRWRGAVESAIRGRRGQAFLKEMLAALDAMPDKKLISNDLVRDGEVCAIGAVGVARGMDMIRLNPEDREKVSVAFGISTALAAEIAYINDNELDWNPNRENPEHRWQRVRDWVLEQIRDKNDPAP